MAVAAVSGCDSRVGIEGTDYDSGDTTSSAAAPEAPAPAAETSVTIALENRDPAAADALTRWAIDLQELPTPSLVNKCWTMAPRNVETMYADKQAILGALAEPGADDGTSITWKGPAAPGRTGVTVVAQRSDIATGYACPRVFPSGTDAAFTDADARHTVRRYLARATGKPLDPADREATHPLLCTAATTWDPTGSGSSATPPLAAEPDKFAGARSFVDQSITSDQLRRGYLTVSAPVTGAAGVQQERTFTVRETEQGYCIGDVSP